MRRNLNCCYKPTFSFYPCIYDCLLDVLQKRKDFELLLYITSQATQTGPIYQEFHKSRKEFFLPQSSEYILTHTLYVKRFFFKFSCLINVLNT